MEYFGTEGSYASYHQPDTLGMLALSVIKIKMEANCRLLQLAAYLNEMPCMIHKVFKFVNLSSPRMLHCDVFRAVLIFLLVASEHFC